MSLTPVGDFACHHRFARPEFGSGLAFSGVSDSVTR